MSTQVVTGPKDVRHRVNSVVSKIVSYFVFIFWTILTVLPVFWMTYSSFKHNRELTLDIFSFPNELINNAEHEFVRIGLTSHLTVNHEWEKLQDPREPIVIESTTITSTQKTMWYYLIKEDMPPEIQNMAIGDKIKLQDLPFNDRSRISWDMTWFNFRKAFELGKLGPKFLNSVIYSAVSTFLVVILGLMISFAVAKLKFPKMSAVVSGVVGLGYLLSISSVIIPLFLMLSGLGLRDSHLGVIMTYVAFGMPLAVLLGTEFIRGLPDSLIESAQIDGASIFRTFLSIILPMTVPVIITISIMTALGIWNEFLLVLIIASAESTQSLPVGIFSFSSLTSTQLGFQLAALVIGVLPALIVYFIFSKQLTQGVVGGAIKE